MAPPDLPDLARLPEWVGWIARDADGTWWAYEAEPNRHDTGWYENEIGRSIRLERGATDPDWQDSLRRVRTA
jgi:hypothetical protein